MTSSVRQSPAREAGVPAGPLTAILAAVEHGARTVPELAGQTGLSPEIVEAGIDHLVRAHRVRAASSLAFCPAVGCASCAFACADGGCSAGGPAHDR